VLDANQLDALYSEAFSEPRRPGNFGGFVFLALARPAAMSLSPLTSHTFGREEE
jgi:hypothetical protein